jgi:transcriptional regulator with XRE-family HTH domain
MKFSDMKTFDQVLAEELKDPEFRARWERTALARAIANQVIAYRDRHALTQTQFGKLLGMKQPAVARLEAAEHNPSIETLVKLATALDMEVNININPKRKAPKLATKRALTTDAVSTGAFDKTEVLVAARA